MLSENPGKKMNESNKQKITNNESIEIDDLKASYWASVAASAHNTFSEPSTFQLSPNEAQKSLSAKSHFVHHKTSQWLLASKPKAFESVNQDLPSQPTSPIEGCNGALQTHLPDIYRVTLRSDKETKISSDPLLSFSGPSKSFKASNSADNGQGDSLNLANEPLHWVDELDSFNQDFSDNDFLLVKEHWTSKILNNPKMVAAVIGLCLLASSVYAGLGYWWLTSSNLSHAAEPENGKPTTQSSSPDLFNIKALQKQVPSAQPTNKINPNERLIAQAEPVATFAMADSVEAIPELSGRPDPFSPLIQETNGSFIAPTQNQDALTGVQYTGFIGGVNSKNKIAIIKVADANPAVSPKTLFKKAGESFYINGERIYLFAIGKTSLSLQLKNENRSLALNPYKIIVNNTATTNAAGTTGSTGASPAASGSNSSSIVSSGSASSSIVSSSTGESSSANATNNTSTSSNSARNSGNGININLEE